MAIIIAIAVYDGGIDIAVPALLIGLGIGYASFFVSGYADADDILWI